MVAIAKSRIKAFASVFFAILLVFSPWSGASIAFAEDIALANSQSDAEQPASSTIDDIVRRMTLDEKISQMIMPAIRTWDDDNTRSITIPSPLADALTRHQYCGVILFGANIETAEQTVRLTSDLQANNARGDFSTKVPYLIAADQEGGSVARITMGTRGTGSSGIGAAVTNGEQNALTTGRIFGQELSALGINVNFGPCVNIISNPNNGMNNRVFNDDAAAVGTLASAFCAGVSESRVITTFKHFPGAGDGNDDPTAIHMPLEQLQHEGLSTYRRVVDEGADLVMVSAVTFPDFDDVHVLGDGSLGHYPASMSSKIVNGMLRGELGFTGVAVTDALDMEQFVTEPETNAPLVQGQAVRGKIPSVEYAANVAQECINAGCDILLMPSRDIDGSEGAAYFDEYIAALVNKIQNDDNPNGTIPQETIDNSVRRILTLKQKYGILDMDTSGHDVEEQVAMASRVVGSAEHHMAEMDVARDSVTLLKNDHAFPIAGTGKRVVILGRLQSENAVPAYAIQKLQSEGVIDKDAYVNNLATGQSSGSPDARTTITLDYYAANSTSMHYSDEAKEAIAKADVVVCFSTCWGLGNIQPTNAYDQGVRNALSEAHSSGAKFVLISNNLPYDTARYSDADALMCCYLSTGMGVNPAPREDGGAEAYDASCIAALESVFGAFSPTGTLPVHVPALTQEEDGSVSYDLQNNVYQVGDGITYAPSLVSYQSHVQGIGWQDPVCDGETSGTVGEARRLEALVINAHSTDLQGSIEYRAHLQSLGWQNYVSDGEAAGTVGEARRLEAIQVRLTGQMAEEYDVWYRAHVQGVGWLGWAKNDSPAGTQGLAKRLEAVQVLILPKGTSAPGQTYGAFESYDGSAPEQDYRGHGILSTAHVQTFGWQKTVADGQTCGTQGLCKRMEAIALTLGTNQPLPGSIEYRAHVQSLGWQDYVSDGEVAGTVGEARRLEAIQVRLTGQMAEKYDVWYRAHVQGVGWMEWECNDTPAGTQGLAKRLEAVQIILLPKGVSLM